MASFVQRLHSSEDIICDQLYDAYDPRLWLSSVIDAQNTLLSPFEGQLELLVNLKSSLIGFTLKQSPYFPKGILQLFPLWEGHLR